MDRLPTRDYTVRWNWRQDPLHHAVREDEIKATTAPRAINALIRTLRKEYEFEKSSLVIHEAVLLD